MARDRAAIAPERLREIREALLFGESLGLAMRLELLALLERAGELAPARRGRPADQALRTDAAVVGVLHENCGIALKAAIFAAAPSASAAQRSSIERTYRTLRSSGETVYAPALRVRAALGRLKPAERRK